MGCLQMCHLAQPDDFQNELIVSDAKRLNSSICEAGFTQALSSLGLHNVQSKTCIRRPKSCN